MSKDLRGAGLEATVKQNHTNEFTHTHALLQSFSWNKPRQTDTRNKLLVMMKQDG